MPNQQPKIRTRKSANALISTPVGSAQHDRSPAKALRLHIVYCDPNTLKAAERQLRRPGAGKSRSWPSISVASGLFAQSLSMKTGPFWMGMPSGWLSDQDG